MKYQLHFKEDFPHRALFFLCEVQFLLVIIYSVLWITGHHSHLFSLDGEANIPAWFSSLQLALVGFVLLAQNMNYDTMSRLTQKFIRFSGFGFLLLSADEAGGIHEAIGTFFRMTGIRSNDESKVGIWVFLYLFTGIVILIWGWKAVKNLYRDFRKELILASAGMAIAIIGGVMLESLMHYFDLHDMPNQTLYKLEVIFEEWFEMFGISLVFFAASGMLVKCQHLRQFHKDSADADNAEMFDNKILLSPGFEASYSGKLKRKKRQTKDK